MNSRQTPVQFVFILALAMLSGPTSAQQTRPASASGRVNILLITVDDMNWDSPGCFGSAVPDITPNIDRMAAEGMRFTNAHVTIAVCTPSRSVLLTGMYPHHNGAEGFQRIRPDVPTLPAVLGGAGYLCGTIGKSLGQPEIFKWANEYGGPTQEGQGVFGRQPQVYYRFIRDFINKANSKGCPFFIMANSHDPHRPFHGSEKDRKLFHAPGSEVPDPSRIYKPNEICIPGFLPDLPDVRTEVAQFYSSVRRADGLDDGSGADYFEYQYDLENRLTSVGYNSGGGLVTVAEYRYDALGRRIEFINSPPGGSATTTRYYYEGQNVVAEYTWNGSTQTPARRYVNGSQYIDERVALVEAGGIEHYYLHEEVYSVAGLAASNGMLEEAVVYDTYGEATIYAWKAGDVDRDGTVTTTDKTAVYDHRTQAEPLYDVDLDGGVDDDDVALVDGQLTQVAVLRTYSALGNPYLFTGRTTDTLLVEEGRFRRIQDNRNRTYDPHHGRWFQRDPLGVRLNPPRAAINTLAQYRDGANLVEYVRSNSTSRVDANGLECCPKGPPCPPYPKISFSLSRASGKTINGPHDALMHYLIGGGQDASLSSSLINDLKGLDFYYVLMQETLPEAAKGLIPDKCCVCEHEAMATGSLFSVLTAPIQTDEEGNLGKDPGYSFRLNNTVGTINTIRWEMICNVGTCSPRQREKGCCRGYAKYCRVHFQLDDRYTFNTGIKDWIFQKTFGDWWGGEDYDIHNDWADSLSNSFAKRVCP